MVLSVKYCGVGSRFQKLKPLIEFLKMAERNLGKDKILVVDVNVHIGEVVDLSQKGK